jgi:hypothetical protein
VPVEPTPPPPIEVEAPATPVSAPSGPNPEEVARLQKEREFLLLYDQYRVILLHELTDLTGERKAKTMLARTVELARNKHPEIFRNANWDAEGNLLDDGSLDEIRMLQNKSSLDPAQADSVQDLALGALYELRMQAVEKGLGVGLREKIRSRYCLWLTDRRDKAALSNPDVRSYDRLLKLAV